MELVKMSKFNKDREVMLGKKKSQLINKVKGKIIPVPKHDGMKVCRGMEVKLCIFLTCEPDERLQHASHSSHLYFLEQLSSAIRCKIGWATELFWTPNMVLKRENKNSPIPRPSCP
jgi:hypothetical protein